MRPGLRRIPWPEPHTAQVGLAPGTAMMGIGRPGPNAAPLPDPSRPGDPFLLSPFPVPTGSMLGVHVGTILRPSMVVGLGNRHDHP